MIILFLVNVGDYIQAVLDRNLAENISRVLYPNDNVRMCDYNVTASSEQSLQWIQGEVGFSDLVPVSWCLQQTEVTSSLLGYKMCWGHYILHSK